MKKKKEKESRITYESTPSEPLSLREAAGTLPGTQAPTAMIRTQIYLTKTEHEYLQTEAERRGEPMSAYLRRIIDERMNVPEDAWRSNPMLEPTPEIEGWSGDEDGALNHDHYAYGGGKKYEKSDGQWRLQPPADE